MKQYIGTKIIQAEAAFKATGVKNECKTPNQILTAQQITALEENGWKFPEKKEGYKVRYADGYESWSPKDVFEAAYRRTDGMNFGLAIEAAKMGKKIARAGWNGKNQYVELAYCISVHKSQGSEYRAVVLSAWNASPYLLSRSILYTAITRARTLLIIVGREDTIAQMVNNAKVGRRYTGLKLRLQNKAG